MAGNYPKKDSNKNKKNNKDLYNRIPPQSVDMEESVLGSIMIEKDAILRVIDFLAPDDFYKEANKNVYEAILDLMNKREPIDLLTITNKLEEKGVLETIGGQSYLAYLADMVPSAAHVEYYAQTVQKKSTLRKLINAASEISKMGYDEEADIDEILDKSEKEVFSVSQKFVKQDYVSMKSALEEAFDRIDEIHRDGGGLRGLTTGFHDLDNTLGGMQRSNLIILAARPSLGKTSFALDIARNTAKKTGKAVVIFSLEMSKEEVVDRLICAEARVDLWKMRTGRLANEDFSSIAQAMDSLSKIDVFIDDTPGNSVMKMRAMLRRVISQVNDELGLIVIDYLQLMESAMKGDNIVQQVGEISRSLKGLAREFNVPVIALSQLSRAVESRSPQIPRLSDLRESGSIEQDADVVMFIYREERENPDTDRKGIAEIHIAKQRNGPVGKIDLGFKKEFASFTNLDKAHYQQQNG